MLIMLLVSQKDDLTVFEVNFKAKGLLRLCLCDLEDDFGRLSVLAEGTEEIEMLGCGGKAVGLRGGLAGWLQRQQLKMFQVLRRRLRVIFKQDQSVQLSLELLGAQDGGFLLLALQSRLLLCSLPLFLRLHNSSIAIFDGLGDSGVAIFASL